MHEMIAVQRNEEHAPNKPERQESLGSSGGSSGTHKIDIDDSIGESTEDVATNRFPSGSLSWNNLRYSLKVGKDQERVLLDGVSGEVKTGELVAIMGSSGAGKTTLLNCLSGRISTGKLNGDVALNGRPRNPKQWKKLMAFVEQDDHLYSNLTVRETLQFAARLRLSPQEYPTMAERDAEAEKVLKSLRLTKAADTHIGDGLTRGVSGGERKRTAIGQEIVGNPRVLFLDEPTSGLDSNSAFAILENVKKEAMRTNRIVLLTIHQPSYEIMELFSTVIFLAEGTVAYMGSPEKALLHFEEVAGYKCPIRKNPADFFMDCLTVRLDYQKEDSERVKRFKAFSDTKRSIDVGKRDDVAVHYSIDAPQIGLPVKPKQTVVEDLNAPNSWFTQFSILLKRATIDRRRDKTQLIAEIVRTVLITVLMGFSSLQLANDQRGLQNRIGVLFVYPVNAMFSIMQPILGTFPLERIILRRERAAGSYQVSAFYLAKLLIILLPTFFFTVLGTAPLYWIIGLQSDVGKFFTWIGVNLLVVTCAVSIGLLTSAAAPTVTAAQAFGPLVGVVFMLFGGQAFNVGTLGWWFRWLHYVSPVAYAYRAFAITEFTGLALTCNPGEICINDGEEVLRTYDLGTISVALCAVILASLATSWILGGYVLLRRTSKPARVVI
ncbi:P-loop containing nucleoside triphosphate hydrolase protein [Fimicolochytrium jonesii]|uniref:P-loop containing nucleoside triphosphate hydrolase protein n=1 Tax=Fimicolochytrium jonesii TaxID=1396493 RepID=UPI0022FF3812|nr:P-loop containing nucleoside triphosphate hydrolase protein [Fimicolochytrium jonesii]KAI8823569.1 P-loop containing nucleoside triphosphate hydrolase protein [Fimicolochytrium jonesii]